MQDYFASARLRRFAAAVFLASVLAADVPQALAQDDASTGVLGETGDDALGFASLSESARHALIDAAEAGDGASALILARTLMAPESSAEDRRAGVDLLEKAAAAGILEAQVRLAGVYADGLDGIAADPVRAAELYRLAVEKGDNNARRRLAALLLRGRGLPRDPARAQILLEQAAAEGHVEAAISLAGLYLRGEAVAPDGAKAADLLQRGVVSGSTWALKLLGDLYRQGGVGLRADPVKALVYFEEADRRGDAEGRRKHAEMVLRGEGTAADPSRAVAMLEAAGAADPSAYLQLGDLFAQGEDLPSDAARALGYYRKAADAGLVIGLVRSGDLHRRGGAGLAADTQTALHYYEEAAATGDSAGRRALADLLLAQSTDSRRAIQLLADASSSGDGPAALMLGELYARGGAVPIDYGKAANYFRLASDRGISDARLRQALVLLDGPLAKTHFAEGLALLASEADAGTPGAAVELARLQLAGRVEGQGATDALALLDDAARGGDRTAARFLLQLYRDGYGGKLAAEPEKARTVLAAVSGVLGEELAAVEAILLNSRGATSLSTYAVLADDFAKLRRRRATEVLEALSTSNSTAYLYLVQAALAARGLHGQSPNGLLDLATIRAIQRLCSTQGQQAACEREPVSPAAAAVIGAALFAPPQLP